jgi:hypothetical protein
MADKFSRQTEYQRGTMGIMPWMEQNVLNKAGFKVGPIIDCVDIDGKLKRVPLNGVSILYEDCFFMRQGSNTNYGIGGSNCVTGNPVKFVETESVFPEVFNNSRNGILHNLKAPCYCLPLCQIDQSNDMEIFMTEAYSEFIALKKGDTKPDITHITNGICSGLAAICFNLAKELTLNGKSPNENRLIFLVEALHALSFTALSCAKKFPELRNIFTLLPYVATSADTLQSTLLSYIFNEIPCLSIRVKHVGSSIFRYFNHEGWEQSYIKKNPVGLISLLLVAPMLSELINTPLESKEIVDRIAKAINTAILTIVKDFQTTDFKKLSKMHTNIYHTNKSRNDPYSIIHLQNKQILRGFALAGKSLVTSDLIDKIYDAVLMGEKDIASFIGINQEPDFVRFDIATTVNNLSCGNYPILVKVDDQTKSAIYVPSDPREWTAISLVNGLYRIICVPLGNAEIVSGNTASKDNIANYRITLGREILKGNFVGYSASGMYYNPRTQRFENRTNINFLPLKEFEIESDQDGISVSQDHKEIIKISNNGDMRVTPLLCFKYCKVKIELVRKVQLNLEINNSLVESENSDYSTNDLSLTEDKISPVLSLTDSLKNLNVDGRSVRKSIQNYNKNNDLLTRQSNIHKQTMININDSSDAWNA